MRQNNEHMDSFECQSCGHLEPVESRSRVYEPGYSDEVSPTSRIGWCHDCSKVVQIEYVPSMQELEEEMERIKKEASLPFKDPERQKLFNQRRFAYLAPSWALITMAEYIRWRTARKNPSRCFGCGSYRITLAEVSDEHPFGVISCPKCSGRMLAKVELVIGSDRYDPDVYSFEGDLLKKGNGLISIRTRWVLPP